MEFEVLSPSSPRAFSVAAVEGVRLSGAPSTIGFVWHYGYRGDEMFSAIAERFQADHAGTAFVDAEVFGNIHGASETRIMKDLPAKLEEHGVEAVVAGVGG